MNRRGFEMSFAWIFSIIVGAVIIFLAVYAALELGYGEREVADSIAAQELQGLFYPLTTTGESASKPGNISFPTSTRLSTSCLAEGVFGIQEIRIATRSGVGNPWQEAGVPARSSTTYLFAANLTEGKDFFTLVQPFNFPFKIGDIITLWNGQYCFINPPQEISNEIESLHLDASGFIVSATSTSCPARSTQICFLGGVAASTCTITVDVAGRRVIKQRQTLSYEKPLFYAAIVADSALYECQVQRMFHRSAELARLYRSKSEFVAARSHTACSAALQPELSAYATLTSTATTRQLSLIEIKARQLATLNGQLTCPLWEENMLS